MGLLMPDAWPWTIAGIAVAAAIGALHKWAGAKFALDRVQDEVKMLRTEKAELQRKLDVHEKHNADEFTRPLKYPKNHV